VTESAAVSLELAVEAMRRSLGDKSDALNLLLDSTKREHLEAFLAAEAEAGPTLAPRYKLHLLRVMKKANGAFFF